MRGWSAATIARASQRSGQIRNACRHAGRREIVEIVNRRAARDAGRVPRRADQFAAERLVEGLAAALERESRGAARPDTLGDALLQQRAGMKAERLGGIEHPARGVSLATGARRLRTRSTVATLTPALSATSRTVARGAVAGLKELSFASRSGMIAMIETIMLLLRPLWALINTSCGCRRRQPLAIRTSVRNDCLQGGLR